MGFPSNLELQYQDHCLEEQEDAHDDGDDAHDDHDDPDEYVVVLSDA